MTEQQVKNRAASKLATIAETLHETTLDPAFRVDAERLRSSCPPVFRYTVGIDPGVSGAVAAMTDRNEVDFIIDLPTLKNAKGRNEMNGHEFGAILRHLRGRHPGAAFKAYIEEPQVRPPNNEKRSGVIGALAIGKNWGILVGCLQTLAVPYAIVRPQAWKAKLGFLRKDKDFTRTHCIRSYPYLAEELKRKKDVDRADAIMMARYGEVQEHG